MNERIKELAIEAGYNPLWDTKADREEYFDKEKFAELIVQECAKACEENSYLALNGWQRAKQIREHFGVE